MTHTHSTPLHLVLLTFSLLLLNQCAFMSQTAQNEPTQLEVRQFQTREYEGKKTKEVMKAMINVLQDDQYMIKNADLELGLLSASKQEQIGSGSSSAFQIFTGVAGSQNQQVQTYDVMKVTECTVNLTESGKLIKVRTTFTQHKVNNFGAVSQVKNIASEDFYTQFFDKVSKGLFLEDQGL